jgi:endonuclease I
MRKIHAVISALALTMSAFAQAPVPTSYDFENGGTYPTGWTLNPAGTGTQYYTSSSSCNGSAYSLKIDFAGATNGENLVINVSSQPGPVTYNIKGATSGSSVAWDGTFSVQESITGAAGTYTTIATHTGAGALSNSVCVNYTATPTNANSRYIRFIYLNKVSGNVAVDDITIAAPNVAVGLRVKQGTTQIGNGGWTTPVGTTVGVPLAIPLTIENIGTSTTLSVTAASITGANASEFTASTSTPFSVNAGANTAFNLNFTPTAVGTRTAALVYTTNDPNNTTFTVNLYGVGGTLATAPTAQASGLNFTNVKTFSLKGQFTTASPAVDALGGYLILRKNGGAVTDAPVNGSTYQRGQYIGTGGTQVVYAGPISAATGSFSPSYIRASMTYGFAIYAYNGSGTYTSYNLTTPLTQTVATPFSMQLPAEYATISTSSTSFLTNLSALINPHTSTFYSNYTPTMIDQFETRDTLIVSPVLFTKAVTCSYSGLNRPYNDPFDYTGLDWSREHTYCHSWMPTYPADAPTEKPEYNDQHHLYPVKQTNVNAQRSNYPLGEVVTQTASFMNCKAGTNASGKQVFEPRNEHKGNAARAIFYMATCYNGISGKNWKLKDTIDNTGPNFILYGQDQNVLKKWHFQDPPDSYERSRNDFVESIQGNRNPFIDSVRYACYIDFKKMTYIASPTYTTGIGTPCYVASSVGINESTPVDFEYVLAPNPTTGDFKIMIESNVNDKFEMYITDITGRVVHTEQLQITNGFNDLSFTGLKLNGGVYFVNLNFKDQKSTRKLIIQ